MRLNRHGSRPPARIANMTKDPDNRLVAGELERRWNERLALRTTASSLSTRPRWPPLPTFGNAPPLQVV